MQHKHTTTSYLSLKGQPYVEGRKKMKNLLLHNFYFMAFGQCLKMSCITK